MTHICVSKLSEKAASHYTNQCWIRIGWSHRNRRQWNLNLTVQQFSLNEIHLKMLSAKCHSSCLGFSAMTSSKHDGMQNRVQYMHSIGNGAVDKKKHVFKQSTDSQVPRKLHVIWYIYITYGHAKIAILSSYYIIYMRWYHKCTRMNLYMIQYTTHMNAPHKTIS